MADGGGSAVGGVVGGYGDRTSGTATDNSGMLRDCKIASAFSAGVAASISSAQGCNRL